MDHLKVFLLSCLFGFSIFERVYRQFRLFQELPYDKDDDVIKATSFEVISTLRDAIKSNASWRDHVQQYIHVCVSFIHFLLFLMDL